MFWNLNCLLHWRLLFFGVRTLPAMRLLFLPFSSSPVNISHLAHTSAVFLKGRDLVILYYYKAYLQDTHVGQFLT